MNYSFHNLNVNVNLKLVPVNLISGKQKDIDIENHKAQFGEELSELWLAIMECLLGTEEEVVKKKWMASVQQQLVALSDRFNHYLFRENKIWATSPYAAMIRGIYISSIVMVNNLLDDLLKHYPNYYSFNIKMPNFRLRMILPELRHLSMELMITLEMANIGLELTAIIKNGLNWLINFPALTYSREKYLRDFVQAVHLLDYVDDESLGEMLVKMNFNLPSFHLKRVNDLEIILDEIHGLHDQVEKVIQQKQELEQVDRRAGLLPEKASLIEEMNGYLTKKRFHLEELLAIRRTVLTDRAEIEDIFRMKSELPVEQIALFIRMMQVKGVIVKKEVGEVFNFFARYFYTDKALFISPRNMLKKSTDVNFSTVLKIWQLLEDWKDWLDEMFSVRNYQRKLK